MMVTTKVKNPPKLTDLIDVTIVADAMDRAYLGTALGLKRHASRAEAKAFVEFVTKEVFWAFVINAASLQVVREHVEKKSKKRYKKRGNAG